jgi:hypothetical protein
MPNSVVGREGSRVSKAALDWLSAHKYTLAGPECPHSEDLASDFH